MEYKIEKNVPILGLSPERKKYPLLQMEVGDSFVLPIEDRQKVYSNASYYGLKITTRRVSDTQIRVWRVK